MCTNVSLNIPFRFLLYLFQFELLKLFFFIKKKKAFFFHFCLQEFQLIFWLGFLRAFLSKKKKFKLKKLLFSLIFFRFFAFLNKSDEANVQIKNLVKNKIIRKNFIWTNECCQDNKLKNHGEKSSTNFILFFLLFNFNICTIT